MQKCTRAAQNTSDSSGLRTSVCACIFTVVIEVISHVNEYTYVNKRVQLDATVCRHLLTAKSLYMFRVSQHPSSGALKTVTATSGIGHNTGTIAVPVL